MVRSILFVAALIVCRLSQGNTLSIESKIDGDPWKIDNSVEVLKTQRVLLKVPPIKDSTIRWYQIFPQLDIQYNNAVWPWLPNAYQWQGYATIKYQRVHLSQYDDEWEIEPIKQSPAHSSIAISTPDSKISRFFSWLSNIFQGQPSGTVFQHHDIGSFWYQAEVVVGNTVYKSPGIENITEKGLRPDVLRISIRQDNNYIGHLTSYFNVPGIFGSTPYQVKNYIGVDCADVLMAAYAKWKGVEISKDYNVTGLVGKLPKITTAEISHGQPDVDIYWERTIKPGDLIAVKYQGAKQYQHIGALYKDNNDNGVLDPKDIVIHAGPDPLHFSRLSSRQFDGTVVILRPN